MRTSRLERWRYVECERRCRRKNQPNESNSAPRRQVQDMAEQTVSANANRIRRVDGQCDRRVQAKSTERNADENSYSDNIQRRRRRRNGWQTFAERYRHNHQVQWLPVPARSATAASIRADSEQTNSGQLRVCQTSTCQPAKANQRLANGRTPSGKQKCQQALQLD